MAPFQFIVLAVLVVIALLLGTLVVCGSVLIDRIRSTNATLRRIEEALISRGGPILAANARAPEVVQTPQVSTKQVEATRYLTIRDLKSRDGPRSPRAATRTGKHSITSKTPGDASQPAVAAISESHDALSENTVEANVETLHEPIASSEPSNAPADRVESVTVHAANTASSDGSNTDDERASVHASPVENEIISASLVCNTTPTNTAAQLPTSPVTHPVNADAVAKKNRDALLIMLNNQRRRRHARQGY